MAANQQTIANDPHAYLSAYVALAPSNDALMQLSGPVAAFIQEQQDPTVASIYLAAGEFLESMMSVYFRCHDCVHCE